MIEDKTSWGIIVMTVLASIAYFAALVFAYVSDDKQSLAILEGMGGSAFAAAISYHLGSSAGSQRKSDQIAESSAKKDALLAASVPAPLPEQHLPPTL